MSENSNTSEKVKGFWQNHKQKFYMVLAVAAGAGTVLGVQAIRNRDGNRQQIPQQQG